jgi:hypothetical protein
MIYLICTLEPVRIPFLRQFVEHYIHLGVERFLLSLQVEPDFDPEAIATFRDDANAVLRPFGVELNGVLVRPFSSLALREHHDELQRRFCRDTDWIVWADIDEFQVYPGDFKTLIGLAESYAIDYFRGFFVDRVAEDGKVKAFDPDESIWTQFPRQVRVLGPLTPGMIHKVTCARGNVFITRGNHFPENDTPLRYYSEPVDVHHFKWDLTVVSRLSRRLQPDYQAFSPWWVESKAVIDFIESNGGAIVTD